MAGKPTYEELKKRVEALERESIRRKKAEALLTQALKNADVLKERFRTVVDHFPFGIALIAKDGAYSHINPKFKELFGYNEEDIPNGREWFRKAYPDPQYRRKVIAAWVTDMRNAEVGEKRPRIFAVTGKDGENKIVNFISVMLTTGENLLACEDITDQKRAEEALRESERRMSQIIEFLPDAAFVIDNQGKVTAWNKVMESLTGIEAADMLGKGDYAYAVPFYGRTRPVLIDLAVHYDEKIACTYGNLRKEGNRLVAEKYLPNFRGRGPTWLWNTASPLYDPEGKVVGAIESIRDITELKKTELALKRRLDYERAAADCMRLLVKPWNIEEQLQGVVETLCRIVGASRVYIFRNEESPTSGLCTTQIHEAVTEGVRPEIQNPQLQHLPYREGGPTLLPVLQSRQPFARLVNQIDGPERPILEEQGVLSVLILPIFCGPDFWGFIGFDDCIAPQLWHEDDINLLQVVADGIGAAVLRERSEKALRESEEKYRTILENIEDGYYEVDVAGNLTFFNEAACRMLGYSREELAGMNNRKYTSEENAKKIYRTFNEVYRTGAPAKGFDWEILRKDGTKRSIESSVSLIKNDSDQPVGFRGIVRDITERKELENQLRQAQKMEALGTLAGGIAHDFNNLLQAISGYTQLLLWGKSGDESGTHELREIERAAGRAAALIRQLLAFSRKVEGQRRPVDLNREIMDVEKVLHRTIPKMIDIEIHLSEDLRAVRADPIQMEQILLNLGSNAADAMPDGGTLKIESQNASLDEEYCRNHIGAAPGEYVLLTVTDTGYGMDRETVQHIFEPFFTTKEIGRGTGLGLASVYGIVKSHGGYIACQSEVNRGTAFKIYLPAIVKNDEKSEGPTDRKAPRGGNETILVVDDELSVREFAERILRRFGYRVLLARSGEEALEIYRKMREEIDLVILDLGMPGMGGYACLRELLAIDPSLGVMIASGYAIDARMKETLQSGVAGYIGKPYQFRELLAKVRAALDARGKESRPQHL
jgi:two-component system, cell cycle sensor histidine kinase and response regulator CckA